MKTRANENEWEEVASPTAGDYTERLAVPGGYLYRTYWVRQDPKDDNVTAIAMVFVPGVPA